MKYLILLLLVACSSKNDLMTSLINEKKDLETSIQEQRQTSKKFERMMLDEMDSVKAAPLVDSNVHYELLARQSEKKLKAVNFSIDSLSKMK